MPDDVVGMRCVAFIGEMEAALFLSGKLPISELAADTAIAATIPFASLAPLILELAGAPEFPAI
jgi:hypothetical protein